MESKTRIRPKVASYGREVDLIDAFRRARRLLTHRKGDHKKDVDAWRLERAQWHYDFGNRAYAERELADINAFRAAREIDKPGQYPPMELRR